MFYFYIFIMTTGCRSFAHFCYFLIKTIKILNTKALDFFVVLCYTFCMIEMNGKKLSSKIKESIKEHIEKNYVEKQLTPPCLVCILVGNDPASKIYVASKEKQAREVGIVSFTEKLDENASADEVKQLITKLNNMDSVSGILLQLPLPKKLSSHEREIVNTIDPQKDVDFLTDINLGKLFADRSSIAPCTASGIMEILHEYDAEIKGKKAVVIGRSLLVGKSVAALLLKEGATVEICHSKTKDLAASTKTADILICAVGKPNFVNKDMVKPGAVCVDVGINRVEDKTCEKGYKVVGDMDKSVSEVASKLTPVPNGVGPMTIALLFQNTVTLHEEKFPLKKENTKNKVCDNCQKNFKI